MDENSPNPQQNIDENSLYRLVDGRHGRFLANPNDIYIGRAIVEYGEFSEIESTLILQFVPEGGTVIEVGANIGAHTVAIARTAGPRGRVHAYEPQPVIFQNLCANLALNNLTNVYAYNKGCGAERSRMTIPDINYAVEGNYGGIAIDALPADLSGQAVDIEPLDELDLTRLDLLKIDAEGMETEILQGAAETVAEFTPILYVENDRVEKSEALITLIQSFGYRLWWHTPALFNPDNWAKNIYNPWPNIVSFNMLCIHQSRPTKITGSQEITEPTAHPMRC